MKGPHWWEKVAGAPRKKPADPGLSPPALYGITETGRRERNEDAILALPLIDAYLLAVADGLGGHAAGDYASNLAIRVLKDGVISAYHPGMTIPEIEDMLRALYDTAHHSIRNEAVGRREGMGTTLISALIRGDEAVIANTGDSRAYLVGKGVDRITKDHSIVQSLVDEGLITEEQAGRHPMRNILSSSLGALLFRSISIMSAWWMEDRCFFSAVTGYPVLWEKKRCLRPLLVPPWKMQPGGSWSWRLSTVRMIM